MRHCSTRGAGAIGNAYYSALFGELPDKKNGPQSPKSEAGRNSKQRTSTIAQMFDCGKHPPSRGR